MKRHETEAAIEAILFATGRAVPEEDIARALDMDRDEIGGIIRDMAKAWDEEARGVELIELEGSWQMCTRKAYYPQLIALELVPKKPRLTDVLLETLSVIAYKQPVTKAEIERIRGVNSDHAVNKLVEYKLVAELGRAKAPGRPILFGTTQDFLRVFGISSREKLPGVSPEQVAGFREEAEEEAGAKLPAEESGAAADGPADEIGTELPADENGAEMTAETAGTEPPADEAAGESETAALPELDRGEIDREQIVGI